MKLFASALFLAAFAVVTSGHAQNSATDAAVESMSGIHRPTPKPSGGTTATATGPTEFGLYKDAKGKEAATTYGVHDSVYLVCKNVSADKGDKLSVVWFEEKGGKSKKVSDATTPVPDKGVYNPTYNLPPAKPASPTGNYHVELSHNGKLLKKLAFKIQ